MRTLCFLYLENVKVSQLLCEIIIVMAKEIGLLNQIENLKRVQQDKDKQIQSLQMRVRQTKNASGLRSFKGFYRNQNTSP